ncbi:MAG: hypothetical protein HOV81_15705 [Kofleriaceae bacterium]|nr:hypothetical protein [Kofleriaceae bacterium]
MMMTVGSLALVAFVVCVLGMYIVMNTRPARALRATRAARRAKRARRDARERSLPNGSIGRDRLAELTRLVDEVEDTDPALADRMDLEALLDRYASLMLGQERVRQALAMSDRGQLQRLRDALRIDHGHAKRLELCERRLRCIDKCIERADSYADEVAIIEDLVRLIAQRVACPDGPSAEEVLDLRLFELEIEEESDAQFNAPGDQPLH